MPQLRWYIADVVVDRMQLVVVGWTPWQHDETGTTQWYVRICQSKYNDRCHPPVICPLSSRYRSWVQLKMKFVTTDSHSVCREYKVTLYDVTLGIK